jgi:malonate-semialdehyde dehydrogenase (acetylating)/methylmalonate-semialdehyde dehydrogenase
MLIPALKNYINGEWVDCSANEFLEVKNPASNETLARVPLSTSAQVEEAAQAAHQAFFHWRQTPITERVQYLFKMKNVLENHLEELAKTITLECGKTLAESRGELRRAIENVEIASAAPLLIQGYNSEDIARGIDEMMIRQPLGVTAAIAPFNFPAMIAFWFLPYAIVCGNTMIVKPSERVPMTMQRIFQILEAIELPKGVINLVNGGKEAVDALLEHPLIRAISFVGSTPVARYVYGKAAANGKRAQCQGGAKNPVIILPDADLEMATEIVADSAFGCAGQRCLASSLAITVGDAGKKFPKTITAAAGSRKVGFGLQEHIQMGPVISPQSQSRIEGLIEKGLREGAKALADGRGARIPGYENGNFIKPTVLADIDPHGEIARTEIFGPVLGIFHAETIDEAIEFINSGEYGNMACLFTGSGANARKFQYEAQVGNIGINIGVAAPMASFPFSGWKNSFFGDLHGQGRDAIEFFTQEKVVVQRWPKEWTRKF